MRFVRDASNTNVIVGIFLLIVLAVFTGPNALPRLLANIAPIADEGVPCDRLRQAADREKHQSLIGRTASTIQNNPPVSVRVLPSAIPSDPGGEWLIRVVLINDSIGTIPVVINSTASIGDNGQSGLGVVFNGAAGGAGSGTLIAGNVRLLGPRQRCVQRITIPASQLGLLGVTSTVKAYYRNSSQGFSTGVADAVYSDWGLWVGVVESDLVTLTFSAGT